MYTLFCELERMEIIGKQMIQLNHIAVNLFTVRADQIVFSV